MTVLPGYSNDRSPSIHFVLSIECLNSLTPTDICALPKIMGDSSIPNWLFAKLFCIKIAYKKIKPSVG